MSARTYCDLPHPGSDAEADDWCRRYHRPATPDAIVEALAGIDPDDHGPGCDGPNNCTCGIVQ